MTGSTRRRPSAIARKAALWLGIPILSIAASPPLELALEAQPGPSFVATFLGSAPGVGSGEFRGQLTFNGSPAEMRVTGRAEPIGSRLRIRASLRYADVPADWLARCRSDSFDCGLQGEVAGSRVSWSGTLRWEDVVPGGRREILARFVKLSSFELTALSPRRSEGRAVLAVTNPFSFPVSIASARYDLRVNGEDVGDGTSRGRVLRADKKNTIELPFRVDPKRFLTAAGSGWAVGAEVDASLVASVALRLPAGDRSLRLELSGRMGTDGARSGVFSLPEGGASLSPR